MNLLAPCVALALCCPLSAQALWTVNADGTGDFANIQAAIDAATDGDLIVVEPGGYSPIQIVGKGLTIQARETVTITAIPIFVPEESAVTIDGLAANQTVTLRGFEFDQFGYYAGYTGLLNGNDGAIVFEDCTFRGAGRTLEVRNSDSVTCVRSTFSAPAAHVEIVSGFFLGSLNYSGLGALNSSLYLYDCEILGGAGLPAGSQIFGPEFDAVDAGVGLSLSSSTAFAHGCTISGGSSLDNSESVCSDGADGGVAVRLSGSSQATLLDCTLTAGAGGAGSCGSPDGLDADLTSIAAGAIFAELEGSARHGQVPAVAFAGEVIELSVSGLAGDQIFAALSNGVGSALPLPGGELVQHVAAPFELLPLAVLPASGELTLSVAAPPLPAGTAGALSAVQFLFFDGQFHESGPTQLLVTQAL